MTPPESVILEITRLEAAHLSGLIGQFAELMSEPASDEDPAVQRLVPDAYPDDEDAAREFRSLTQDDLLDRRRDDARVVIADLAPAADIPEDPDDPALRESVPIVLDRDHAHAWLRTLAAVRLVLATRLGIADADDHVDGDPRFGIYDWLGYRLDGLVRAVAGDLA
ncbi:DUF2017 family protein [Microbacterium thalassium]|uniref:DUF2017 domain-containing protein n=1 Tax=Microbacterium thalassium TaxID=362649 RepID=A0A7X0FQY9_9MICO|nr:DUF2017 family protein [Microbacterium thalassium]MBB6392090.1 hypothetical protein [Microbacterium thalassium]GLK24951.1 hypothetical protein GCM10017607_22690 [Microbacterium thalassium]